MPLDPRIILDSRPTQKLRGRLRLGGRCPRCGYDLAKHTGVQCPECGYVLAAELIASDPPPGTLNLTLWFHRTAAASAAILLVVLLCRWGIAWLRSTPRPDLIALIPLTVCIAIWVLFEWTNAYIPQQQRKGLARVLLTLISIIALWNSVRWL